MSSNHEIRIKRHLGTMRNLGIVHNGFVVLILWLTLSYPSFVFAKLVEAPTHIADYFIDTWTTSDGLPHNSINAIAQTQDGYLWFGTWEGASRYNGKSFTNFLRSPQTGMSDSGTNVLKRDRFNRLWVAGTRGSLTYLQLGRWHPQPPANNLIHDVYTDQHQGLWLAVEDSGLAFRRYLGSGKYSHDQWLIQGVTAYQIVAMGEQLLYVATSKGLYQIKRHQPQLIHSYQFQKIHYLTKDHQGNLLLATDNGIWRYDGKAFTSLSEALKGQSISLIEQDCLFHYWIGTEQGIARMSPAGTLEYLEHNKGLDNKVLSWYADDQGSIWVGTNGGLMRLRQAPFVTISPSQGLIGSYTRAVIAMTPDHLLAGTNRGLSLVMGTQAVNAISQYSPIKHASVLSLSLDYRQDSPSLNKVFVGTSRQGLLIWQAGQLSPYLSIDNGLPDNEVHSLLSQANGDLWVGTAEGLLLSQANGEKVLYDTHSGLPSNFIISLAEDSQGNIWVGTGNGVATISPQGQIETFDLRDHEDPRYIFDIDIDIDYLWFTTDRGIVRYDRESGHLVMVGRNKGFPIDKFFQFVHQRDNIWLTSNRGIWKLNYQQLNQVADGQDETIKFEHFDKNDGLSSSQSNGGSNPAATFSQGRLYVATAQGVATVNPLDIDKQHSMMTPIVIENLHFDNQSVSTQGDRIANPGTSRVSIQYAGLSYVMADGLEYRTRLENFNQQWTFRGKQTVVEYTNLPPGQYQFLVSTRFPYGEWSNTPAAISFTILPFWWQKSWVQALLILSMVSLVIGIILLRVRQLKLNQKKLARLVTEKTQELQRQAKRFEQLSHEDSLTGLANRRAFNQHIKAQFQACQQSHELLHLAIVDIDFFKKINDNYSHLHGDQAITSVATILRHHFDDPLAVARWGGEEFTLLLKGNRKEVDQYVDQLRQTIADKHFDHIAPGMRLTVSIGLCDSYSLFEIEPLFRLADEALLKAKEGGRNRTIRAVNSATNEDIYWLGVNPFEPQKIET
ncbi:diguanylate cyclase (plasmid) [Vibrio sp. HB236076]|uniref:diguanylate cyclase n=2 Tax=unclassified Vibrio TaxID=2614977 RepID=A0AB39HJM5_9VIBR